ncbi:MAG: gas vesicle protein GvpK [bacterium]|nr:gas vesicle protein GvpK [bacterium]
MVIKIDENNLKQGVLGLVLALVEVIRDALMIQAIKRMESGILTDEECERLGKALMDLDVALEEIIREQGLADSVQSVRDELDKLIDDVVDRMINPGRWEEETHGKGK